VATLTSANVIPVYLDGKADLIGLFALRKVSTGDTIDLSSVCNFQIVKAGVVLGVSDFVEIAATFTGTVVTMPSGLTSSSGYLLCLGC
jgi:flagella basal body P-ring formation protein FlgA